MADRYAAQRSRREVRRRSLPRLSDEAPVALQERESDETDDSDDLEYQAADASAPRTREPAVTVARRLPRTDGARRLAPATRGASGLTPTSGLIKVDYSYVKRDLRRIAFTAVTMLILLIVLNVIVQNLVH
jgi:hypothetical protein